MIYASKKTGSRNRDKRAGNALALPSDLEAASRFWLHSRSAPAVHALYCFRRPQKNLSNLRKSMRKVVFALISLSYIISLVFAIQPGAAHAAVPAAGKADAGAASFKRYCAGCHSVDPEHKLMGPTLCSEMRGLHRKTTKDVRDIIVQGNGHMPRFGSLLSEQELTDLLAYIRTL
jgi:mono/diheme cytochrome c family protein